MGRFITEDPLSFADGLNLYQYCHNNSPNAVDFWGKDTYYINNYFNSSNNTWSPISHSFIAITKKDSAGKEKVVKTFSWTSANGGSWEDPDKIQNIHGAQNAIDKGVGAWKKGDSAMDAVVEAAFEKIQNQRGGYWPFDGNPYRGTCKNQANKLLKAR